MVKVKGAKPFNGVITDYNSIRPEHGGKPYLVEVKLDDGSKAYILGQGEYEKLGFPNNFRPYEEGALSEAYPERKCHGEYWEADGKRIIVAFKYFGD